MAKLRTPDDLGNVIRQRRRMLAWDQARLAHEVGVSRRWIIEIEKGKPRAELHLVLRTFNVLGITLDAMPLEAPYASTGSSLPRISLPDIDNVIERNREPATGTRGIHYSSSSRPRSPGVNEPTAGFAADTGREAASDAARQAVQAWLEQSEASGKSTRKKP